MAIIDDAFNASADLSLWYKLQSDDSLMLGDVRELIPLRWPFFRDQWNYIKPTYVAKIDSYSEPELLRGQIDDFSNFIQLQQYSNPQSNPLRNQTQYFQFQALWDVIPIDSLSTTIDEQKIIQAVKDRVNDFTRTDFIDIRSKLTAARDELGDVVGGTDPDYNRVYGRSPTTSLKTMTTRDIQQLQYFQNGLYAVDYILANISSVPTTTVDPFALAKANANNPDYVVQGANAGMLVRMQYGENLSTLAARYLGNSDRWIEIAITNGLKPPYVDEVGEKIVLISNGARNQINLPATDPQGNSNLDKLFINQIILLQSDATPFPDQRSILTLKTIPISGEIVLELSGDLDLSKFTTVDNAYARVFKPNTTNSQFFIMIPGQGTPQPQLNDVPWFLKTKKEDEKQAGVDLALDTTGDLMFTSGGDLALSYGLANAIQAVQIKMATEKGSSSRNPDFGIAAVSGQKTTNSAEAKSTLTQSILDAVQADSRFSGVDTLQVGAVTSDTASGFLVQLVVRLAGTGSAVPITFTINQS